MAEAGNATRKFVGEAADEGKDLEESVKGSINEGSESVERIAKPKFNYDIPIDEARESLVGLSRIDNYSANFRGFEVRAQRSLGHLSDKELQYLYKKGLSPKDINGNTIILHHHEQNVAGPIIEMPMPNHSMSNIKQHPLGNRGGVGTGHEREAFNAWRVQYWKCRYAEELIKRGVIK